MDAATYDVWYETPPGNWMGDVEYRLLHRLLAPSPAASLLDVGCGTGYFTRRFARDGLVVTGVDPSAEMLQFAAAHAAAGERYLSGDARDLPFPAHSFDFCISVTALCFIREQAQALSELLRVVRKRFAIGLLNRHSILYLQKGSGGGRGGYRGAHWHTIGEVKSLFSGMPVQDLSIRTAVLLPRCQHLGRAEEHLLGNRLPWGAFLVAAGTKAQRPSRPSFLFTRPSNRRPRESPRR